MMVQPFLSPRSVKMTIGFFMHPTKHSPSPTAVGLYTVLFGMNPRHNKLITSSTPTSNNNNNNIKKNSSRQKLFLSFAGRIVWTI